MPNQPKNPALNWRPPREMSERVRALARRRNVAMKVILDEALGLYLRQVDENGPENQTTENGEDRAHCRSLAART